MKFLKLSILFVFVFSSLFIAPLIFAEVVKDTAPLATPAKIPEPSGNLTVVATVNIEEAKIVSQDNNNFKISFDLTNREGLQSGIRYGVKLVGVSDKGQYTADEKVYTEILTLYENSSTHKEIEYTSPSNLSGDYTIYLISKNESGFPFGVAFTGKVKLTSSITGVNINNETCNLTIKGDISKKTYTLTQGVDILKDESLILNCKAINSSDSQISVIPNFETTSRTLYGDVVSGTGGDTEPIIFKSKEEKTISITLPKASNPQAYDVKVSLKSGENFSNTIVAHYVLSGPSSTVQNISLDKDYYKKGDTAIVSFVWSARADSFPGSRTGNTKIDTKIAATIKDGEGKICADTLEQTMPEGLSVPKVEILITKDCKNPSVVLSIKDSNGNILDEKGFAVQTISKIKKDLNPIFYYLVIIISLLGLLTTIIIRRKKNLMNTSFNVVNVVFPFLLLVAIGTMFPITNVKAATFSSGDVQSNYYTLVNVNLDKSNYDPSSQITVTTSSTVTACDNASSDVKVYLYLQSSQVYAFNKEVAGGTTDYLNSGSFKAPSEPGHYSLTLAVTINGEYKRSVLYFDVNGDGECLSSPHSCSKGYPGDYLDTNLQWNWSCSGYGDGKSVVCPTIAKGDVNGSCNSNHYTCNAGTSIKRVVNANNWTWLCQGSGNGEDSPVCSEEKSVGVCGEAEYTCLSGEVINKDDHSTDLYVSWNCKGLTEESLCYKNRGFTKGVCSSILNQCETVPLTFTNADIINTSLNQSSVNGVYSWSCPDNNSCNSFLCQLTSTPCSIDLTKDVYGSLTLSTCIIPDESKTCKLNYSWKVENAQKVNDTKIDLVTGFFTKQSSLRPDIKNIVSNGDTQGNNSVDVEYDFQHKLELYSGDTLISKEYFIPKCEVGSGWFNDEPYWRNPRCIKSVNGGWSDWGLCALNNDGNYYKKKLCNSPAPLAGGLPCPNSEEHVKLCTSSEFVIIRGPLIVKKGDSPNFEIQYEEPTGQKIRYTVMDFDGAGVPYYKTNNDYDISGAPRIISKTWNTLGTFTFKANAENYNHISTDWSYFKVTVVDELPPTNGVWSDWTPELTCGTGPLTQTRTCSGASNGGTCDGLANGATQSNTVTKKVCTSCNNNGRTDDDEAGIDCGGTSSCPACKNPPKIIEI